MQSGEEYNLSGELYSLVEELFPYCRSITGDGVRQTLRTIRKILPLEIVEIPTGTRVLDWEIPEEWNINDGYIRDEKGNKLIDFQDLNLHVLNYSSPVNKTVTLQELKEHTFTLPDQPDLIPYRTSYYQKKWGFCMSQHQLDGLTEGNYRVYIDSEHKKGHLTYGEFYIKGKSSKEILISTHICHPSLCNDNLSGIAVSTFLAKSLSGRKRNYSYRFLFIPGTIGSIAWLSRNEEQVKHIEHGLTITLLGDKSEFTYKKSRRGNSEIDQIVAYFLEQNYSHHTLLDFIPYGYDERQYCSPGYNLPVGCFTRTPFGEFKEYHTSGDNLEFVSGEKLQESLNALQQILAIAEHNKTYINTSPKGEPQLGRRGLYEKIGGSNDSKTTQLATLWVLNMSDGSNSLLDIAMRSGIEFDVIVEAAEALKQCGLLRE
jgi:aminopeptidase-like protein